MNNIKNMVDNGDISGAISQISPEMIQNFSKILNQNNNSNNNNSNSGNSHNTTINNENSNNSFNMNNLDMDTVMKITSAFNKMNNQNDPRANLLYSLKPYLRER